jgi:signal transduction histidine kinase
MSKERVSYIERELARRGLRGFAVLVAGMALFALAWALVWHGVSVRLDSEVDAYTRQEALTLARTLLYDLAADRRIQSIQELEDLEEGLPVGAAKVIPEVVEILAVDPSLPDALVWEKARKRGLKIVMGDVAAARRELYHQSVRGFAEGLEEDLWARVTLSDHLRAVRVTSQRGSVVIAAGEVPPGVNALSPVPLGQASAAGTGLLAVRLPLHIGLRRCGEVWCLLDRSAVIHVGEKIRGSVRAGQVVIAAAGMLLLAALIGFWYALQRGLRKEVVVPVVQLARRMEDWEQEAPPRQTAPSETAWLSDAFDRLLGRVRSLLAERDAALERVRNQQETLLKAERLGLLERMGAGLSHELNNALNPAWLRLEEIRLEGRIPDPEDLLALRGHLESARSILKDLGSATRRTGATALPLHGSEWLAVSLRLVEPHFRSGPPLRVLLPEPLPAVSGDAQHLIQCVVNLLLNARDAASAKAGGGGGVSLSAESREGFLVVRVEDDGPGVPEAIRGKLFEPFVTTKHHGSGLGLFFVDSVVRNMGGWVRHDAGAQRVTRFEMALPLAGDSRPAQAGSTEDPGGDGSHGR